MSLRGAFIDLLPCISLQTEYEGQAKKFMEVMDPTDAIVVAGGDGTVSEVVIYTIL